MLRTPLLCLALLTVSVFTADASPPDWVLKEAKKEPAEETSITPHSAVTNDETTPGETADLSDDTNVHADGEVEAVPPSVVKLQRAENFQFDLSLDHLPDAQRARIHEQQARQILQALRGLDEATRENSPSPAEIIAKYKRHEASPANVRPQLPFDLSTVGPLEWARPDRRVEPSQSDELRSAPTTQPALMSPRVAPSVKP